MTTQLLQNNFNKRILESLVHAQYMFVCSLYISLHNVIIRTVFENYPESH